MDQYNDHGISVRRGVFVLHPIAKKLRRKRDKYLEICELEAIRAPQL
jgi:hypothetical protein